MPVQEDLLALVQVRPRKRPTRRRQPHDEQLQLTQHPGHIDTDRAKVDLRLLAETVTLRDHHLGQRDLHAGPDLGHEPTHRRLADLDAVLIDKPLPPPPGRVTLLTGAVRSASSHLTIGGFHGSSTLGRGGGFFRTGGTAEDNGWRTVRR